MKGIKAFTKIQTNTFLLHVRYFLILQEHFYFKQQLLHTITLTSKIVQTPFILIRFLSILAELHCSCLVCLFPEIILRIKTITIKVTGAFMT
jgi:hypothetical protein